MEERLRKNKTCRAIPQRCTLHVFSALKYFCPEITGRPGSAIIQLIIPALLSKQLLMGTTLDNTSLLQDHDTVTVAYCGKSVGDHEGCPAFHQLIHTILYQFFGTGINGTGGFVQDQDRRICNSCTGDGEKLSLALAQVCTVSTEKGVITLWKPADKTVSVCLLYTSPSPRDLSTSRMPSSA